MAGIRIVPFMGMLPRVAERLLGDGASVDATNVNLTSGEIRPIRQPALVHMPSASGPWLAVYRAEWEDDQLWLAWNKDVDVARSPLPSSVEARYFWSGDNEPRYAEHTDLPSTFFAMGIPRPQAAPGVSHSGGTGAAVSRFYVYTFYSALNEEGPESPVSAFVTGKVDGTWAISGMDAFPANSGTGTASHLSGVTTFANTGNHWLRAGDEITLGAAKVVVATVPTAGTFTVAGNYAAETAWSRVAPWNTTGMKRRLYRSSGTTGTFQLVHDDVGTSYNDTLVDTAILGDELISQAWEPPPTNLRGLISLPDGSMAGFFGNQLCRSEPYQPHAWPVSYRRATDFEIVAIESFGTTVVAATAGRPYIAQGVEPSSVTVDSVDWVWPCLSKRSMVSIGDGVLFATSHGLAYVGMNGAKIWTDSFFSSEEWSPLNPASMVSAMAEGKIYVRYDAGANGGGVLVFSPSESSIGLRRLSLVPDELYADRRNGKLYLVDDDGVHQYDAGIGPRLSYSWKSKEYHLPNPINLGAAKVDFVGEMTDEDYAKELADYNLAVAANNALVTGYSGIGGLNGSAVNGMLVNGSNIKNVGLPDLESGTFTLYCEGKPVYSRSLVADQRAFKLPAGFRADDIAVGLTGTLRIKNVKLAETMQGLKAL